MKGTLKETVKIYDCVFDYFFFIKDRHHWCVDYHENGGPISEITSVRHLEEDSVSHGVCMTFNYTEYKQ